MLNLDLKVLMMNILIMGGFKMITLLEVFLLIVLFVIIYFIALINWNVKNEND